MGTRSDFYIGRGENAQWLGSVAFDGYPSGITLRSAETEHVFYFSEPRHKDEAWEEGKHLFDSATKEDFLERLNRYFLYRDDVTLPEMGWPWPWNDSGTSDYAYAFDDGRVWCSCFGHEWFDPRDEEPEDFEGAKVDFPDMSQLKNVQFGGKRSGLLLIVGVNND